MENKTSSKNNNPKRILADFFDGLIRDIDIYTEETHEHYKDDHLFEFKPEQSKPKEQPDGFVDVDFDSCDVKSFDLYGNSFWEKISENERLIDDENLNQEGQDVIQTRVYVNRVREEMIKELERAQAEAFEYYETIKDQIQANMSQDEIESILFARNYFFTLTLNEKKNIYLKKPLKMHLVKLDFYFSI